MASVPPDLNLPTATSSPAPVAMACQTGGAMRIYWPCRIDLAEPGCMAILRDITPLVAAVHVLHLDEIYAMDLLDIVAVLMAPVTFGQARAIHSQQLGEAASQVGATPDQYLACLLSHHSLQPISTYQRSQP